MESANNSQQSNAENQGNLHNDQNNQVAQGVQNDEDLYVQLSSEDEKRLFEFLNKVEQAAKKEGEENINTETISQIQQWKNEVNPTKSDSQ